MIARKLKTYLESRPAIVNKLAAEKWGIRIRVDFIPQGMPRPYVRLQELGATPDYHLAGELSDLKTRVQCDVWADSEAEAEEIAELIRLAPLSGYRGSWEGTPVQAVKIAFESGTHEDEKDGSDDVAYRNTRDYQITYQRAVN